MCNSDFSQNKYLLIHYYNSIECTLSIVYDLHMSDYIDVLKKIGLNFRVERIKRRLSQEKFAELANVHTNYIGKVERGEQNLTIKKVVVLADSLGVPVENIFHLNE